MRVGLNLLHMRYDKNLSEYTLGHGAYFSPQNYMSVSLPVRFYGRGNDDWSYLIGASISHSWSSSDEPYLLGGGDSDGGGFGYYLEAALERRISRRWYVGSAADIHRADFTSPTIFRTTRSIASKRVGMLLTLRQRRQFRIVNLIKLNVVDVCG